MTDNERADRDADGNAAESEGDFSSGNLAVADFVGGNSQDVFAPDLRESYTNPDPTAKRVGTDAATGNPIWQLIDAGGNLVSWAVDAAGSVVGVTPGGAAGFDNRLTYKPPAGTKAAGTDPTTGNPLFQLVDEGGKLIQYGINWLGEAVGISDVTPAKTGGATPLAPGGAASNPLQTGDPGVGLLESLLTGGGTGAGAGTVTNINTTTDARTWNNTQIDTSNRSVSSTILTNNVNTAGLVSSIVDSITGLFKGSTPTLLQSAPSVAASDDTLFGTKTVPQGYTANQRTDWSRAVVNSNAQPKSQTATITGDFGAKTSNFINENKTLVFLSLLVGVVSLFFIVKRRA